MDKQTLSNYGWIVICTLVLVVMIALAGPFGTFVSEAVQSTTQGLFDVNKNALNAAGIEIEDNSFGVKMLDGNNQSYLQGHAEALSFRSSAEMKDFESVEVDGETVAENNYTVTEGSTIITLLEDYLNQLPVGTHTVTIVSATGKATATFIVEDVAEINGKWVLNDTLNIDAMPNCNLSVNYTSDGDSYANLQISSGYIIYYNVVAEAFTVYNGSWVDDELRTIDFGENTQIVSKEFYEWFTANATQTPVVYELSGKWVFNETLNQGTNPNTTVSVNYTTDGDSYRYMDVYDGMIFYSNSGADAFISYNEGWMDDAYKIVDFGTSSQTVTKAFYDWFTANATQAPVVYEISGKWVLNEVLNHSTMPDMGTISVNYTSDGDSYRYMDVYSGYITYLNSSADAFMVYNEGWMDDALRAVDFGTGSQTVSKEFYEWFTASASKQ